MIDLFKRFVLDFIKEYNIDVPDIEEKLNLKECPILYRLKMCNIAEEDIMTLVLSFSKEYNIDISLDKSLLTDVLIPEVSNLSKVNFYTNKGIDLPKKGEKSIFITHCIETALEKGFTRKVVLVETDFYLFFLESLVRKQLIKIVSKKKKVNYKKVLSWILFLSLTAVSFIYFLNWILIFYIILFVIRSLLVLFSGSFRKRIKNNEDNIIIEKNGIQDMPILTILIPLYKEKRILKQLIEGIDAINYPKSLLDIKIITESDDIQTNLALKELSLSKNIQIIPVPLSHPRTKSKAMNYATNFALGKYIGVYDAENIPNPDQAFRAILKIKESKKVYNDLICNNTNEEPIFSIQCPLQWYNWNDNLFTMFMSIEYHIIFNKLMPISAFFKGFIPLGGTSNFFARDNLYKLDLWNSYNVTEDFELSIRSAIQNLRIKYCTKETEEGCVNSFYWWRKQRTRWIKGFIVSFCSNFIDIHLTLWKKPFTLLGVYVSGWVSIMHPIMHTLIITNFLELKGSKFSKELLLCLLMCNIISIWDSLGKGNLISKIITTISFIIYNALLIVPFICAIYELCMNYSHWNKTDHEKLLKQCPNDKC